MEFYHNLITQKSWQLLQLLKKKYVFILIGGWAVFLYSRTLKSKDIDLIIDYPELEKLKKDYPVVKNERLKKYEAKAEETEIDIYLPHYSNPGLPAEEVSKFTNKIENFTVPRPEILALLKAKALVERRNSSKGRKDILDLVSLFSWEGFDFTKLTNQAKSYQVTEYLRVAAQEIKNLNQIEELDLNTHRLAKLKKQILPKINVD